MVVVVVDDDAVVAVFCIFSPEHNRGLTHTRAKF